MTPAISLLVDAYWLASGPPSGRNVVSSFVATWRRVYPEDRLVLAVSGRNAAADLVEQGWDVIHTDEHRVRPHGLWVSHRLARAATGFDAVLSQNFSPLGKTGGSTARVAFVHDLLFTENPNWFTMKERLYLNGIHATSKRADLILTSSVSEMRRITRIWPARASAIKAVGLSVPTSLAAAPIEDPKLPCAAEGRPFLLAVGRLNVRKNLGRLVSAYLSSPSLRDEFDLIIVGSADGRGTSVRNSELPPSVRFVGSVTDGQLAWLYTNCRLFIFPSLDEGFGLPLIEAAFFGAPAVASDIPVFREIDAAQGYFDPQSVEGIRASIEDHARRVRREPPAATIPRWDDVVVRTRTAIEAVLREKL